MTVVLMYHALFPDGDASQIDAVDLPYAVSESEFLRQLDVLGQRRCGFLPQEGSLETCWPDVVITFDDGHVSNHRIALPHLNDRGLEAYLFLTSGFIGQRAGFCDVDQVADMANAGLRIGAHGVSHRFFDDMSDQQARDELRMSRESLMQWSGREVNSLSFPGGRFTARSVELARDAGFDQLFGSEFGMVDPTGAEQPFHRVPVRRGTTLHDYRLICSGNEAFYRRVRRRQSVKAGLRRVLGNKLYHGLYKSLN